MSSLTGLNQVIPFSLTGLQNINGTINGSIPIDTITILGQTIYLTSSVVDNNGNVNLTLSIPNSTASVSGLLTSTDFTIFNNKAGKTENNIYTGTNVFNNSVIFSSPSIQFFNLGSTLGTHFLGYNPSTGIITSNPVINLLISNNTFTGTNYFTNADIRFSGIVSSADTSFLRYNDSTGQISKSLISSLSILGDFNTFTNKNYFTNQDIRFSGLVSSGDTSFLRYNDSTGAISKSLISSLSILGLNNTFTNTNTFSSFLYLNTANTLGLYIPSSTVMRIGNIDSGSPQTTNAFMDFNNSGSSAIYGNGSLTLEVAKTVLGSSSDMFLNNRTLYLRGVSDFNHYLKYDGTNIDGWVAAGYNGGNWGSTSSGNYKKMHVYDNNNNVWFESNGDQMSYLVRQGVTNLKWVVFKDPTNYAFYDTTSNTLGTTSDARNKTDIQAIDTNKSKQYILSITPTTYKFKSVSNTKNDDNDVKVIGFIAQDLLKNAKTKAQKNIVSNWKKYEDANGDPYEEYKDGNGIVKSRKVMLGVSAMSIIPELVGTIQQMEKENQELKSKVLSLEERLNNIEKIISIIK